MSTADLHRNLLLAGGALVIGVATAALTWRAWPLSATYVASAAGLGVATGVLTHRLSPAWSGLISIAAIMVVLDEVAEAFYAQAPLWSAGMFQAVLVGMASYGLFAILTDLALTRGRRFVRPSVPRDA